jgi:type VI secretion system protein ImpA
LDVLCKYYETYEPSSPVPILLKRAKALVNANFMEVLRNLAPDALGQIELIKGPDQNDNN